MYMYIYHWVWYIHVDGLNGGNYMYVTLVNLSGYTVTPKYIQAGLHLGGLTLLSQLWSGSTCSTRRCFAEITIDLKLALISLLLHTHGCTHTLSLPIVQQLLINKSTLGPELHPQMLDMQYTCIINLQKSRQRIWFGDQQPRHQIIVCQYWNTTLTLLLHVKHKGQEGQFTKQVMTTNTP